MPKKNDAPASFETALSELEQIVTHLTPTASQMAFSTFMACELQKAKIPYALNADF